MNNFELEMLQEAPTLGKFLVVHEGLFLEVFQKHRYSHESVNDFLDLLGKDAVRRDDLSKAIPRFNNYLVFQSSEISRRCLKVGFHFAKIHQEKSGRVAIERLLVPA